MAHVRAGNSENQVNQHAAIQGKGIDRALIHHFADTGILRLEQFAGCIDVHGLCVAGETQLQIERGLLAHLEIDGLCRLFESGAVDVKAIGARLQARNLVKPRRVGYDFALGAGSGRSDVQVGAWNGTTLRVKNRSTHHGVIALCAG